VITAVTTGRLWAALLYQRPTAVKGRASLETTEVIFFFFFRRGRMRARVFCQRPALFL